MKNTNLFVIAILLFLGFLFSSCSNSSDGGAQVQSRPDVALNASVSALEIAKKMECGWNLGNTLDYPFCDGNYPCNYGLSAETAWGEVLTSEQIIKTGIQNGYKTIRIPVTWFNHLVDTNYTIDPQWMARVKQIVNWAIDAGYYVILDEHHSVHEEKISKPLQRFAGYIIRSGDETESKKFLEAIWKQIAAAFNNEYDERLIFETLNEPRNIGHQHEWSPDPNSCDECKANVKFLKDCNQLILNVIRASGGNNANRCVIIPALCSGLQPALDLGLEMLPTDSASGKLMVTVHIYPLDGGNTGHYSHHFNDTTKKSIKSEMEQLNQKFVSQGIPVVVGEYGANRKAYDWQTDQPIADYVVTYQDRLECFSYLASLAGKYSIPILNWDADNKWGTGSNTINRKTCSLVEPECVASIIKSWQDASAAAPQVAVDKVLYDAQGGEGTKVTTNGRAAYWPLDAVVDLSDYKYLDIEFSCSAGSGKELVLQPMSGTQIGGHPQGRISVNAPNAANLIMQTKFGTNYGKYLDYTTNPATEVAITDNDFGSIQVFVQDSENGYNPVDGIDIYVKKVVATNTAR
ncbi:MAG: glycoside hydrolase family 5 protein [Treponema sp.]|nr:glycoside hydrolase family 5 protein [Treponema sp.]